MEVLAYMIYIYIHSIGKIAKVFGNIQVSPPFNFPFNWEDQRGYKGILNFHPRRTLHSTEKINK